MNLFGSFILITLDRSTVLEWESCLVLRIIANGLFIMFSLNYNEF